jgi:glycosyltransferase involved in cell wall biosynthesis
MAQDVKYVIVTPVRDEEAYIEHTLKSVLCQKTRPIRWVIVDDGSTDKTSEIIDRYVGDFDWVRVVHRENRGVRKSGAGVVEAFYDGYKSIDRHDWEFIAKLDGDLTFDSDYFEKCFEHFRCDESLGIGGGEIYHKMGSAAKVEATPRFHVRGATKIYRKECWNAIGGLLAAPGWDTIDEVKANMLGWNTYSFRDLCLLHHRLTGSADGALRDNVKHGLACYVSGYHPLFVAASCIKRLVKRPYVVGSMAICWGFIKGHFVGVQRVREAGLIAYLRQQQLRRLCGLESIWK